MRHPRSSEHPAPPAPPAFGPLPPEAAVVVIGAGIPAMACAYYLSLHGIAPVVLAPRADLLDGSTRGIGLITPGLGEDPARLARALGLDGMRRIFRFGQQAVSELETLSGQLSCGWQSTGALMLARRAGEAEDLKASIALLEEMGEPVEGVTARQALELVGPGFLGGLKFLRAGVLEPMALNLELARLALEAGAEIHLEMRDVRVREADGRLRVESSRGGIDAEVVVHAGGVGGAAASPFVEGCILPARAQMLRAVRGGEGVVESRDAVRAGVGEGRWGTGMLPGTAGAGFEYWRWTPDGALWLGGFRYLSLEQGMADRSEGLDARISARQEAVALELGGGAGGGVSITHRWARFLDISCDGLPLVGSLPGQPRQLVVAGFGGLDSSYGVLAARCVMEELLEVPGRLEVPEEFGLRRMV